MNWIPQIMNFENPDQIDGALQRLGTSLLYEYADPVAVVVCGGSALSALDMARRTTRDVDILAIAEKRGDSVNLRLDLDLPEIVRRTAARVGRDLGLEDDWLNMGPKEVLAAYGPPEGMTERWQRREYGPCLTVYFIGRLDQVHLKLLAAADPKAQPHHLEDLAERIRPTRKEIRSAVKWLLNRETSSWFRGRVRRIVEALGYDNISYEIPE
ncbi:MAG: hypothetical protein R6V03_04450 [Kiritimatiellia bacterium]